MRTFDLFLTELFLPKLKLPGKISRNPANKFKKIKIYEKEIVPFFYIYQEILKLEFLYVILFFEIYIFFR